MIGEALGMIGAEPVESGLLLWLVIDNRRVWRAIRQIRDDAYTHVTEEHHG